MKTTEQLIILLSESIINDTPLQEGVWDDIKEKAAALVGRTDVFPDQGTWRSVANAAKVVKGGFGQVKNELNPVAFANAFIKLYINAKLSQFQALRPVNEKILQLLSAYKAAREDIKKNARFKAQEMVARKEISPLKLGEVMTDIINNETAKNQAYIKLKEYISKVKRSIPTDTAESIEKIAATITEDIHINNGLTLE